MMSRKGRMLIGLITGMTFLVFGGTLLAGQRYLLGGILVGLGFLRLGALLQTARTTTR